MDTLGDSYILIPQDFGMIHNKAPACESRGLVHKKRCANFDTPPFSFTNIYPSIKSYRYPKISSHTSFVH